jgi:drug/metabolite transporter (DMT)-like permease
LKHCRPAALYVLLCLWAAGISFVAAFSSGQSPARTPATVIQIALPFGAVAALAGVAFQAGIRYGKLATSWLIINFSAAVPALASILIYHERISSRHSLALLLMAVSVVLLWKDKQADERKARPCG